MRNAEPVAIVGAGVAGLTTALGLARQGLATEVFEQAGELTEVGAGLQLSPNASRILIELGLGPALEAVWSEPDSISLVDGRSLRPLASVPAGARARERWAAPYGVLHRASLQKILLDAVASEPLCRLHLGYRIERDPSEVITEAIRRRPGIIVGADGIWSRMRASIPGAAAVRFSGNIAWRLMLPGAQAAGCLSADPVTAFLAPNAHLVAYPIRESGGFNLVAIVAGKPSDSVWAGRDSEDRRQEFAAAFKDWHPDLRRMLEVAASATYWPLCTVDGGSWHNGRDTILIGDAAHAMTPFAAQGAAMAIEDARELARCLTDASDIPSAFARYDAARRPRIERVRKRAAFNRFAYHAAGPVRIARNLVLATKGPEALAADLDWLYGYGAPRR
ncbi:FAD-dependent monooxygenase [Sinorhizobium saheli]|uniref:Salicylate hydroxylase n=1 Tax=Sinorhizobium saheli TaxID=36856 RepID=A0A178YD94_SINSA|nr:FAD-dependent monooxygenase [Sinorhizobium saheli]MQW87196.1 salicylate hydroxylase [Sinorhizobium saheli]OAP45440.1 salicylate hydroxylase [Sinorhizobium saheli]